MLSHLWERRKMVIDSIILFPGRESLLFLEILPTALALWELQNQPLENSTTMLKE